MIADIEDQENILPARRTGIWSGNNPDGLHTQLPSMLSQDKASLAQLTRG
jgi:hypothetical protein